MSETDERAQVDRESIEEHDRCFPPRRVDESDHDFLLRAMKEHQESHIGWRDTLTFCPKMIGTKSDGRTPAYQQRAVERYDQMIAALESSRLRERQARKAAIEECIQLTSECVDERKHLLDTCWPASKLMVDAKRSEAQRIVERLQVLKGER